MTIPKDVREIIVDLEGDILEAGSLAAILHERLSERHAISSDDDISDGWFQVACHLVKAIRRTNAAWEKLFEAAVSSKLAA